MSHLRPRTSTLGCIALLFMTISTILPFSQSPIAQASGTITGSVFHDFNANGIIDGAGERGVAGVTVTAYDPSNTVRGTATTAADGTYTLSATGTGPYRIEFTALPTGYFTGPQGSNSG